ncbi:MAG: pentapeptide repeat-containing protein, partial [Phycicoccus sp.]
MDAPDEIVRLPEQPKEPDRPLPTGDRPLLWEGDPAESGPAAVPWMASGAGDGQIGGVVVPPAAWRPTRKELEGGPRLPGSWVGQPPSSVPGPGSSPAETGKSPSRPFIPVVDIPPQSPTSPGQGGEKPTGTDHAEEARKRSVKPSVEPEGEEPATDDRAVQTDGRSAEDASTPPEPDAQGSGAGAGLGGSGVTSAPGRPGEPGDLGPLPGFAGWGQGSPGDGTFGRSLKSPAGFPVGELPGQDPRETDGSGEVPGSPVERARRALEFTDELPELPEDSRAEQLWQVARALEAMAEDVERDREAGVVDDAEAGGLVDRLRERAAALREDSRGHTAPLTDGQGRSEPGTRPLLPPAVDPAGLLPPASGEAVPWSATGDTADRGPDRASHGSTSVFPGLARWGIRRGRGRRLAQPPGFSTGPDKENASDSAEAANTEPATTDDHRSPADRAQEALDVTSRLPQLPPDADDVQRADLADRLAQAARMLGELRDQVEEQSGSGFDHGELAEALNDRARELREAAQQLAEPAPSRPAEATPVLALPPARDQRSVQELWPGLDVTPAPSSSPSSTPVPVPSSTPVPVPADVVPDGTPGSTSVDELKAWALDRLDAIDRAVDETEVRQGATWFTAGGGPLDRLARARDSVAEQLAEHAPEVEVPPHPALAVHQALEDLAAAESAVHESASSTPPVDGDHDVARQRLEDAAARVREVQEQYADVPLPQGMSLQPYVYDDAAHSEAVVRRRQVERELLTVAPKGRASWRDVAETLSRLGGIHRSLGDAIEHRSRRTAELRRLVDRAGSTDGGDGGTRGTPPAPSDAGRPEDRPATPPVVAVSRVLEMLANVADAWWLAAPGSVERDRLTERKDDLLAELADLVGGLPPGLAPPTPYVRQQPEHRDALRWRDAVAAAVDATPPPEPGTPAHADLTRLTDRLGQLDDLIARFEAADEVHVGLLTPGARTPSGPFGAPGADDLAAVTGHLFDDGTTLPPSAQDRAANVLDGAGLGALVPGLRSSVNVLDECDACLNAAFTGAMGKRFGSAESGGVADMAPAVAMPSRAWDGTDASRSGRSTRRWTDLWRTLQRLPLVFTAGGGTDPLDAAKKAVREAAGPSRPAYGLLKVAYPKAPPGSLPSHTIRISSDDGEQVSLLDPQTGVVLGDHAVRTGAAHVHSRGTMSAEQLRALPPQELRVEVLFAHDADDAALVPLPDHVLQGYAAPAGTGTKVFFDRSEQPLLEALGVRFEEPADHPGYVTVTYPVPYPAVGADRRVWVEYDPDDPARMPHLTTQHDGRRADQSWSAHRAGQEQSGRSVADAGDVDVRGDLPGREESLGVPADGPAGSAAFDAVPVDSRLGEDLATGFAVPGDRIGQGVHGVVYAVAYVTDHPARREVPEELRVLKVRSDSYRPRAFENSLGRSVGDFESEVVFTRRAAAAVPQFRHTDPRLVRWADQQGAEHEGISMDLVDAPFSLDVSMRPVDVPLPAVVTWAHVETLRAIRSRVQEAEVSVTDFQGFYLPGGQFLLIDPTDASSGRDWFGKEFLVAKIDNFINDLEARLIRRGDPRPGESPDRVDAVSTDDVGGDLELPGSDPDLPGDDESLGYTRDDGASVPDDGTVFSDDGAAAFSDPADAVTRLVLEAGRRGQDTVEIDVKGVGTIPLRFGPADGDSLLALTRWLGTLPGAPLPVRVNEPRRMTLGSWGHQVRVEDGSGVRTIGGYHFAAEVPIVVSPEGVVYEAVIDPAQLAAKTYGDGTTRFEAATDGGRDLPPGWEVTAHREDAAASLERAGFRPSGQGVWTRPGVVVLTDADGRLAAVATRPHPKLGRVWVDRVGGSPSVLELEVDGVGFAVTGSGQRSSRTSRIGRAPSYGALGLVPHPGMPLDPARYAEYEALMRPGRSSSDTGFLAAGESLAEVLERDATEVAALGVSHQLLSGLLQYVRELLGLGLDRSGPVEIDLGGQRLRLRTAATFAGAVDSPVGRSVSHSDYAVENLSTGARLAFNGLLPELVARGFYEGSVPHRLEPRDILGVFAGDGGVPELVAAAGALGIPTGDTPVYQRRTPPEVPVGGGLGALVHTTVRGEVSFDPRGFDTWSLPERERFWPDLLEILWRYRQEIGAISLDGLDLSGLDLSGVLSVTPDRPEHYSPENARVTSMRGVDLRGADLSGADLDGLDLRGSDLSGADLSGANLGSVKLAGAVLAGADLRGANLAGTNLARADLRDADLRGVEVDDRTSMLTADLRGARLPRGSRFAELVAEAAFGPRARRPATLGDTTSTVPVLTMLDAMSRADYPELGAKQRQQLESALSRAAAGDEIHLQVEGFTGRGRRAAYQTVVVVIVDDPVQVVLPPGPRSPGAVVPLAGYRFVFTQPEETRNEGFRHRITGVSGPIPGTPSGSGDQAQVDPTLPGDEESFGVSGDDRPGERSDGEPSEPRDDLVVADDWSPHEAALSRFLETVRPSLGEDVSPEEELQETRDSDAVMLVVDRSGAVRGLARAVLVVADDGSTVGRVGRVLLDPGYRPDAVEQELRGATERRLVELGANRVEWSLGRLGGNEPTAVSRRSQGAEPVVASSGAPSTADSADSPDKPLGMKVGDVASAASHRVGDVADVAFGQTFANLDATVLRPVKESGPVQWLGSNPVSRVTGDGLNALADAYRAVGRFAQHNPATHRTLGWYQALVRQMRYFPAHLLAVKAQQDQARALERAFDFYDRAQRRVAGLLTEAESLAVEVERQLSRKAQAERVGDRISVEDADRQLRPLTRRLGELTATAATPLVELGRRAAKQIGRGEAMLRRQECAAAIRRAELDRALVDDHGVETPRVLAARSRAVEAATPFDLATAVAQARGRYEALETTAAGSPAYESVSAEARAALDDARVEAAGLAASGDSPAHAAAVERQEAAQRLVDALVGRDRDAAEYVAALERARVVYELAKTDLSKFTLAGNDPVLGLILNRDESLAAQLERLRRVRERTDELVDGLRRGRRIDRDSAEQVRSAVNRIQVVQAELEDARSIAERRRQRILGAPVSLKAEARVDQLSVDARAAGSQLRTELGQIGFLHSQAKDIVDGKGKGRIDVLSNAANIEAAARQVALVRAEVAQWQARLDRLTDEVDAAGENASDPRTGVLDSRDEAARRLAEATRRLETRERRLSLEQRAAEPRSIRVRVADLRAKLDTSADLVRRVHAAHARRQAELAEQVERTRRDQDAATEPTRRRRLQEREQRLLATREANDYALQRAVQIHRRTEELLPRAEDALNRARETAGITPGKIGRNFLRGNIVAATAAKAYAVAQLSLGLVAPDTAADLAPVLKQLNLPGAEVELAAGAIQPVPGVKGLHSIDTAQGRVYAWRVRGTFSDIVVVAQPTPQARGFLMAALANGGTLGSLSPSIQKGTDGVYLTIDSQRFQLAGVTISSVFHPDPTSTAFNWWETVKVDFGATGVATRFNSASTNPRTKAKQPMLEMAQSNSIKAPLSVPLPGRVPFLGNRLSLPPTVGMAVTVKNSLGVGRLSLVYDPELGVGQISDRTSSMAAKHNFRQVPPITEWNPGTQPYGFFGTAIRIEKNYYAKYDPRNDGNWLMAATEPAELLFDAATAKPWLAEPLTTRLQSALDDVKPNLGRARTAVDDAIGEARYRAIRTLDDWLHDLIAPPPRQQPAAPKQPPAAPKQPPAEQQQPPAPPKQPAGPTQQQSPAPKQQQPPAPKQQQPPAPKQQPPAPKEPPAEPQVPPGPDSQSFLPPDDATYGMGVPNLLLAGAGLATPMPGLDVNPLGGTHNCLSKAVALDRLRAGMPASALPGAFDTTDDLYRVYGRLPESGFGATAGGEYFLPNEQRFDIDTLQAYIAALPPGARGIVLVHYRSWDHGHALVGENIGGRATFLDSGAVLDPRALSTGAVVMPELLLGVSAPEDLADRADVRYSFLRTDDVPHLMPVPEHVQSGIVVDLDAESGALLVTDPILGASRWVDASDLPVAARPRRGETVYVVDRADADGGLRSKVRGQRHGLWLDPPPPLAQVGVAAAEDAPTVSSPSLDAVGSASSGVVGSASSGETIEQRPLPEARVLMERMAADPGVPVDQIAPAPVFLTPGWRKVFLIGSRPLEGGALFDGWLSPEELFTDGVLAYPPQLPDITFVDTDGGPVLDLDPAGSRWYRHAFALSTIAGRADGKVFVLGTPDRSFLEFEMFFLRPLEETTGRPVIVEAYVPTAVDVRATMFRARYGPDYRSHLGSYLQDPGAFHEQLYDGVAPADPDDVPAGAQTGGTGDLSLPFDPPRYHELAFPGGIRPELIERVHLLDFARTTDGELVFPPLARRDLVDQERYFLPTDSPLSPRLGEQRVYSESIRNPRFDPQVLLGDAAGHEHDYLPPGSGYQGHAPDDIPSGEERLGSLDESAGVAPSESAPLDVRLGEDLATGFAVRGDRIGGGGDGVVYALAYVIDHPARREVPEELRVLKVRSLVRHQLALENSLGRPVGDFESEVVFTRRAVAAVPQFGHTDPRLVRWADQQGTEYDGISMDLVDAPFSLDISMRPVGVPLPAVVTWAHVETLRAIRMQLREAHFAITDFQGFYLPGGRFLLTDPKDARRHESEGRGQFMDVKIGGVIDDLVARLIRRGDPRPEGSADDALVVSTDDEWDGLELPGSDIDLAGDEESLGVSSGDEPGGRSAEEAEPGEERPGSFGGSADVAPSEAVPVDSRLGEDLASGFAVRGDRIGEGLRGVVYALAYVIDHPARREVPEEMRVLKVRSDTLRLRALRNSLGRFVGDFESEVRFTRRAAAAVPQFGHTDPRLVPWVDGSGQEHEGISMDLVDAPFCWDVYQSDPSEPLPAVVTWDHVETLRAIRSRLREARIYVADLQGFYLPGGQFLLTDPTDVDSHEDDDIAEQMDALIDDLIDDLEGRLIRRGDPLPEESADGVDVVSTDDEGDRLELPGSDIDLPGSEESLGVPTDGEPGGCSGEEVEPGEERPDPIDEPAGVPASDTAPLDARLAEDLATGFAVLGDRIGEGNQGVVYALAYVIVHPAQREVPEELRVLKLHLHANPDEPPGYLNAPGRSLVLVENEATFTRRAAAAVPQLGHTDPRLVRWVDGQGDEYAGISMDLVDAPFSKDVYESAADEPLPAFVTWAHVDTLREISSRLREARLYVVDFQGFYLPGGQFVLVDPTDGSPGERYGVAQLVDDFIAGLIDDLEARLTRRGDPRPEGSEGLGLDLPGAGESFGVPGEPFTANVMAPLEVSDWETFRANLAEAARLGVDGVSVDVW